MQRNAHYYRDKRLLSFERERAGLSPRVPVMVPLDPPVERGWVRHFRLTRAAVLRPDAAVLLTILPEVDCREFSHNRQFGPRKSWGRQRRLHYTEQVLRPIPVWRWHRLGWPDEWAARYFRLTEVRTASLRRWEYVFVSEGCYELFSERHYIHELPELDPQIERRLAELEACIGESGRCRLNRMHGRSDNRWRTDGRRTVLDRISRKTVRAARRGDTGAETKRWIPAVSFQLRKF